MGKAKNWQSKERVTSMKNIRFDYRFSGLLEEEIFGFQNEVEKIHLELDPQSEPYKNILGWIGLPSQFPPQELDKIQGLAKRLRNEVECLVVVGIGGSYMGTKSILSALSNSFSSSLSSSASGSQPEILFAGQHMDAEYHVGLLEYLADKDFAINVISKSGGTLETALAFRVLEKLLIQKQGREKAKQRIIATTDPKKGILKKLAEERSYPCLIIPDNLGGRYSVLTAVGLFPLAFAGIEIQELLQGAKSSELYTQDSSLEANIAYFYAVVRNLLYKKGKKLEILSSFTPKLKYVGEWWKQLYSESEGKDQKGIFPSFCTFSTDLHSMGQWIQEGERNVFETFLHVEKPLAELRIEEEAENLDALNFLSGRDFHSINEQAFLGTLLAHSKGGVPVLIFRIPELNTHFLGELIYLFEKACAMSGMLLGINPFDQPGVEAYKNNMFTLLDHPNSKQSRSEILADYSRFSESHQIPRP